MSRRKRWGDPSGSSYSSWYERKTVVILLSLLSFGIKGVRLGSTLHTFLAPQVVKALVEKFDLKPITTPSQDLAAILE